MYLGDYRLIHLKSIGESIKFALISYDRKKNYSYAYAFLDESYDR